MWPGDWPPSSLRSERRIANHANLSADTPGIPPMVRAVTVFALVDLEFPVRGQNERTA